MSIPNTAERSVMSTVQGEVIALSIDQSALAHIMGLLTDVYEDAERACIREYTTNGLDSHIAAGVTRPVEVTLPSTFDSTLTIKDFGVGLDRLAVAEIYSRYGASTKRGTNDQTGQLGIGCKAALTYTDQFTLTGVKDGKRCVVAVSRNAEGAGSMTVLEEIDTDEPNGVEVVIPVTRDNDMAEKAADLFQYWAPGTVLVNGEEPPHVEGLSVSDELLVVEGGDTCVVMGNVPYPAAIPHGLPHTHSLVAYVGMGEVEFTPSREGLKDTPLTTATLERLAGDFKEAAGHATQKAIDQCATHVEAVSERDRWHRALGLDRTNVYKYKGQEVPHDFSLPESKDDEANTFLLVPYKAEALNRHEKRKRLSTDYWPNTLWVHGYDRATFTVGQKKKLMHWWAGSVLDGVDNYSYESNLNFVLLADKPGNATWLDPASLVDWEEIAAVKLPRAQHNHTTGEQRIPGSYDLWEDGEWKPGTPGDDIDTSYPLFWAHKDEARLFSVALSEGHDNCTLVSLQSNRIEKFKRLFPDVQYARDGVQALFNVWAKRVQVETREALALKGYDAYKYSTLSKLDPDRVDDPALKRAVRLAQKDLTKTEEKARMFTNIIGARLQLPKWTEEVLKPYPLIQGTRYSYSSHTPIDHTYLYITAAYAARQKEDSTTP